MRPAHGSSSIQSRGVGLERGISAIMFGQLRASMSDGIVAYNHLVSDSHSDKKIIVLGNSGTFKGTKSEKGLRRIAQGTTDNAGETTTKENPDEVKCKAALRTMPTHNMNASLPHAFHNRHPNWIKTPDCPIWRSLRACTAHSGLSKSIETKDLSIQHRFMSGTVGCRNSAIQSLNSRSRLLPGRRSVTSIISTRTSQTRTVRIPHSIRLELALPAGVSVASEALSATQMIVVGNESITKDTAIRLNCIAPDNLWWLLDFLSRNKTSEVFRRARGNIQGCQPSVPYTQPQAKAEREVQQALSLFANDEGSWSCRLFMSAMGNVVPLSLTFDSVNNIYHLHSLFQRRKARTTAPKLISLPNAAFSLTPSIDHGRHLADRALRRAIIPQMNMFSPYAMLLESNSARRLLEGYVESNQAEEQEGPKSRATEQEATAPEHEASGELQGTDSVTGTHTVTAQPCPADEPSVQALEARKRLFGNDHPETVTSMKNLSMKYYKQGRLAETEALEVEIVASRRRVLGDDHPDTLKGMNNLAITYHDQGRLADAEALKVTVLAARKRVLGHDHPHTLGSMSSLSATYTKLGRLAEAEALKVEVIAARKLMLGEGHAKTLGSMASLARNFSAQGRLAEAAALQADIAATRKRMLGTRS